MHAQQNMAFQQEAGRPSQFSIFQLFTIGIGPSSSHTVGPMRAAADFAARVTREGQVVSIQCELFGSLALTGKGHGTDTAIMLGLSGWRPEEIDPQKIPDIIANIQTTQTILLRGDTVMAFPDSNIVFRMGEFLPGHANAL